MPRVIEVFYQPGPFVDPCQAGLASGSCTHSGAGAARTIRAATSRHRCSIGRLLLDDLFEKLGRRAVVRRCELIGRNRDRERDQVCVQHLD